MVVNSDWNIEYNTKTYRQSGDVQDLKYTCITSEGVKVTFKLNKEGLHIMDYCHYFEVGKSGCIFLKIIIDNNTSSGLSVCHNITSTFLDDDVAIETVEKSKKNFIKRDQLRASRI